MRFPNEREMQNQLEKIDFGIPGTYQNTLIRREVPIGNCIPDFIVVRTKDIPDQNLWPRNWNFRHSHIIWLLRTYSWLSQERIAKLSYDSIERIEPLVIDLIQSGTIKENSKGKFGLTNKISSLIVEVIAIEVKLRDWRKALSQAKNYKRFSDRVFVAMDAEYISGKEEIIFQFQDTGVGLCSVKNHSINWIIPPPINNDPVGPEWDYILASATSSNRQTSWVRR